MIAMLLAAQLATQSAPPPNFVRIQPPRIAERTPNLYRQPAHCRDTTSNVVDRYGRPLTLRLGDLPPGGLILAVDRSIAGCRVITVVRGNVMPDQPNPSNESFRFAPLVKTPLASSEPAMREDGPSNRR
jgi:hypothetical protein